jgi:hypothetical protein
MTNPTYKPGVGRLVTDRYDFERHTNGSLFRHHADQIDVVPTVTIDGYVKTTVQDALQAISLIAFPPALPDATGSVKGIIRLAGDLGGTATSPTVVGLHTYPVSATAPSSGNVLTFDGSSWGPAAPVNNFTAGGDLSGTNTVQRVIRLTGSSSIVYADAATLQINADLPGFSLFQYPKINSDGVNMSITAQAGNGTDKNGGCLFLNGGDKTGTGKSRGIVMNTAEGADSRLVQLLEPNNPGVYVLALCNDTGLTTQMPAGTGNYVIHISNAASIPTVNPTGGAILYSDAGTLNIRQADGVQFQIGSMPNPNTWGTALEFVKTYRVSGFAATSTLPITHSFTVPTNSSSRIDVILIGKLEGLENTYSVNMSATSYWNGASQQLISGGASLVDEVESVPGTFMLGMPAINVAGSTVTVLSGATDGGGYPGVHWVMVIQVTCVVDS